jgi:hypothetical protein
LKIVIEFNLPEDGPTYRSMVNSGAAWDAVEVVRVALKNHLKHDAKLDLQELYGIVNETTEEQYGGLEL